MTRKTARTSNTDVARTPDAETSTDPHGSPRADAARGSARLPRREPTDDERARARDLAPKIWASRELGFSPSQIGSKWRLPAQAIEEVLAAPRPSTPDPELGPRDAGGDGAAPPESAREGLSHEYIEAQLSALDDELRPRTRSARTFDRRGEGRDPLDLDATGSPLDRPAPAVREPATVLYKVLLDGGIPDGRARLCARHYRATSMEDWPNLRSFMIRSGIPAQKTDLLIQAFQEEGGFAVPEAGDSSLPAYATGLPTDQVAAERARLRREKLEQLEDLRLDAMLRQLNPAPPTSGVSPELAAIRAELEGMRAQNAALVNDARDRKLLDSISAQLNPIAAEVERLKQKAAEPMRRTLEDVQVAGEDVRVKASEQGIAVLAERARDTPKILHQVERILDSPSVQQVIAKKATKFPTEGEPLEYSPPQDPAETARMAAALGYGGPDVSAAAAGASALHEIAVRATVPEAPPDPSTTAARVTTPTAVSGYQGV